MGECRMLQTQFFKANTGRRNVYCDSCGGYIGGPRLFCLDCCIKSTEVHDTLDLCCSEMCVGARVTYRQDLESAHEPSHRLVKVRTTLVSRSHGRAHTAACDAFKRVAETRRKIAESTWHPDGDTGREEQKTSSSEPISTEMSATSDKPDDVNPPDDTKGGAEEEGKTALDSKADQAKDESLPTCGKCEGRLSFPFWYCIFCEG
jgi:hypothetical protein